MPARRPAFFSTSQLEARELAPTNTPKYNWSMILQHDPRSRQGLLRESIRKHFGVYLIRRSPRSPQIQCWHAARPGSFIYQHPTDCTHWQHCIGGRGVVQRAQVFPNWFPQPYWRKNAFFWRKSNFRKCLTGLYWGVVVWVIFRKTQWNNCLGKMFFVLFCFFLFWKVLCLYFVLDLFLDLFWECLDVSPKQFPKKQNPGQYVNAYAFK